MAEIDKMKEAEEAMAARIDPLLERGATATRQFPGYLDRAEKEQRALMRR